MASRLSARTTTKLIQQRIMYRATVMKIKLWVSPFAHIIFSPNSKICIIGKKQLPNKIITDPRLVEASRLCKACSNACSETGSSGCVAMQIVAVRSHNERMTSPCKKQTNELTTPDSLPPTESATEFHSRCTWVLVLPGHGMAGKR